MLPIILLYLFVVLVGLFIYLFLNELLSSCWQIKMHVPCVLSLFFCTSGSHGLMGTSRSSYNSGHSNPLMLYLLSVKYIERSILLAYRACYQTMMQCNGKKVMSCERNINSLSSIYLLESGMGNHSVPFLMFTKIRNKKLINVDTTFYMSK